MENACMKADIPTPKVKIICLCFCCHGEYSVKYECHSILLENLSKNQKDLGRWDEEAGVTLVLLCLN